MEQDKQLLERYASLKKEIADIEDELETMKEAVMAIVETANPTDHELASDFGTFSVVQKRKYSYTADTVSKEEALKQIKKEEEAKGIAEYVIQPYLKFSSKVII